jgi:septin family protein
VLRKADSTAAGIDANKMLEALKQFSAIFEEVVGNPRKVNENLVEGFGDGIKDFFSSDKIIGNIQKGFKDWVS